LPRKTDFGKSPRKMLLWCGRQKIAGSLGRELLKSALDHEPGGSQAIMNAGTCDVLQTLQALFDSLRDTRLDVIDDEERDARLSAAAVALDITVEVLITLGAAGSALRSFQHGNTSTEFAREMADRCETVFAKAMGRAR
jgi:hypothetical protein